MELKRADPPEDSFFSSVQARLEQLASIRARIEAGETGTGLADLRSVLLFFAHAKPDRSHTDGYRFYGMLPWVGVKIVDVAHRLGGKELDEIVGIIDSKLGEGGNNFSNSEAFRLKFTAAVHRNDAKTEYAVQRLKDIRDQFGIDRTPHEAVDTMIALAKAYAEVGLLDDAWQSLNSIHEDTFGYWLRAKKEPQYEFWAWAFVHACDAAPEKAGAYGQEFGRFILGMDETEGDETARRVTPDLMKGSCHSPSVASGLLTRLIDSDLTTWVRLAGSTLASIVRLSPDLVPQCIHAFRHLVVPFYDGDTDGFVVAALTAIEEDQQERVVTSLVSAIQRWCPQSRRADLLKQVVEGAPSRRAELEPMLEKALELSDQLIHRSHGSTEKDNSGVSIDIEATSLEGLLEAGDGKSDYGDGVDYSYARAAEKLAAMASKSDIEAFIEARPHLLKDAKFAIACSCNMLRAGETAFSNELFSEAEKAAESGHWSWFVGGEKLALQKLRVERDGHEARERGFDVLIAELASGQTAGSSLFLNLDEILEQVSIEVPYTEFWEETEAHLKQYREYRLASPVSAIGDTQSHTDLLAQLVAQSFSFACPEILDHARAAVLAIAEDEGGASILGALIPLLESQPDGVRETAALCYRLRSHAQLRGIVTKAAHRLRDHADFVVSNQAERILRAYGEFEKTKETPQTLPSFYSLQPSGSPQADNFDLAPGTMPGSRAVWSDDPWTWTSGLRFPFKVLANASGIDIELLRRRCAEFMRREGGREAFGPEAEERVVSRLRRMDLKFHYRRLPPMAAQRGLGMVVNELARAEHVDPRAFHAIWSELGGPPLAGFRFPVDVRPEWIEPPPVPERKHGGVEAEAWLDAIDESLYVPRAPDHFVLAEKSIFRARIWRETVESSRCCLPAPLDISIDTDLHGIPTLFSVDDFQPLYDREESAVVSLVSDFYYGDLRDSTLTLCPHLVDELGWRRSANEPLVITDDNGTIAAQTVRWVDGTDERGFYDSEAYGTGQALLLTSDARSTLEGLVGKLRIGARVVRRVERENGETPERMQTANWDIHDA